ncbi:MAG: hypothetical protein ABS61_02180 [Microbacterium sp. SCN 70-18]|nr:MAG: hypothetical protein ABS61_02180 [Microbacterium sp. SCN 70-18]
MDDDLGGITQQPLPRDQHITFLVQAGQLQPIGLQPVVIDHTRLQFEPADTVQDLRGPQAGLDPHAHQRVLRAKCVGHQCDSRGRTGHHTEPQFTGEAAA